MPNKKKISRGRPKKVFTAKPKVKKSGPGRPKKQPKTYDLPGIGKKKGFFSFNLLHAPKKDSIILLLFVFSLLLFLFALYVTILKGQTDLINRFSDTNSITNVETGNIPFWETNLGVQIATGTQPSVSSENLTSIVTQFYAALNQKDSATLYKLTDSPLRATTTFKTYFSKNRISTFIDGLQGPVQVQDIQLVPRTATSTAAEKITYTLQYTLKDGHVYQEDRSVVLIKRDGEYRIGKIMCDTVKCSTMPFFNPGKYGIK